MTNDRLPVLDYLRAASILLVLGTHALPLGPKSLQVNSTAGVIGMSLFFILSGFLITRQLMAGMDAVPFLIRRIFRIVPLAYLYAFIVYVVFRGDLASMLWTDTLAVNYMKWHTDDYNAHFWSLGIETQFYFAIALLVFALGRNSLWLVWPLCMLATVVKICNGDYFSDFTHNRVDDILVGACVARVWSVKWRESQRLAYVALAPGIVLMVLAASPLTGSIQAVRPYATGIVFASMLAIVSAEPSRGVVPRILVYLSKISYALYVIHQAFMWGVFTDQDLWVKYAYKRPIGLFASFVLAHLSTHTWELWWQNAGKRLAAQWTRRRNESKSLVDRSERGPRGNNPTSLTR